MHASLLILIRILWYVIFLDCGAPSTANGVVIESFNSTLFNATIIYHCEEGFLPVDILEAVCGRTGVWHPNPANHLCVNQSSCKQEHKE